MVPELPEVNLVGNDSGAAWCGHCEARLAPHYCHSFFPGIHF